MPRQTIYRMPETNEEWIEVAHLLEYLAGGIRAADESETGPHGLIAYADALSMNERSLVASALAECMPEIERRKREDA